MQQLPGIGRWCAGDRELVGGGQPLGQRRVGLLSPVLGPGCGLRQHGRGACPEQARERQCGQFPDPVGQIVQGGVVGSHVTMVAVSGVAVPTGPAKGVAPSSAVADAS